MRRLMLAAVPALVPAAVFGQEQWHVEHCVFPGLGLPAAACFVGEHVYGTSTPITSPGGQSWTMTSPSPMFGFGGILCDFTGIDLQHSSEIVLTSDFGHAHAEGFFNAAGQQIGASSSVNCDEHHFEFLAQFEGTGVVETVKRAASKAFGGQADPGGPGPAL